MYPSHTISQNQYSIWSWVLVHLCKMMISPGVFFIFFKFLVFHAVRGVKGQKMAQDNKKTCLAYLRNHIAYDCNLWYTCVKWWYRSFFHFFKILIWGEWGGGGVKGKKWPKMTQKLSHTVSQELHLKWFWYLVFGTLVKWWYL